MSFRIQLEFFSIKKFLPTIRKYGKKYNIDCNILIAIAILENINRPGWVRLVEKIDFQLFKSAKTFGLMQCYSHDFINDKESIKLAAQFISKLKYRGNVLLLGKLYNGSKEYGICLKYVLDELEDINTCF